MNYMNEFEGELRGKLNSSLGEDAIVEWVCESVLQSYRNGIKAGRKGNSVIRDGKSRRRYDTSAESNGRQY